MNVPPEIPPPVPSFELPQETAHRNYVGWVSLWLMIAFTIVTQLIGYFGRDKAEGDARYLDSVTMLRKAVGLKQDTSFGGAFAKQSTSLLSDTAAGLKADSTKDAVAARLYAATLSELGKPVPPEVLAKMRASTEPRDKVFADVFSASKLTAEQAADVEKRLLKGGFISTLATAEAWEKAGQKGKRDALLPASSAVSLIALALGGCFAFVLGIILWVAYLIGRLQGSWPPKGMPLEEISLPQADQLAVRCAQIFGLFLAVPIVLHYAFAGLKGAGLPESVRTNIGSLALYAAILGSALLLFRKHSGQKITLSSIGVNTKNLWSNIGWGLSMAIANVPLVLATAMLGNVLFSWLPKAEHPVTVELQTNTDLFTTITLLLVASVGAPILEEIMFRGTLLPALSKVLKRPVLAILLQGLIFATIHPTGIPAWLALATIGAMSGFLSRQTGSLIPSMVMHGVHNFGTLLVAKAALSWFGIFG